MAEVYQIEGVEVLDPKRIFECVRCDRLGMVSPRGVRRRFRVRMRGEQASEDYCVVCASILTGWRQYDLMQQGRAAARPQRKS